MPRSPRFHDRRLLSLAVAKKRDSSSSIRKALPPTILTGDGTWSFEAIIDGEDVVVENIVITCFGGWGDGNIDDPQDSGRTASHRNTKTEQIEGVALPMDSAQFPGMENSDAAGYNALRGSPLPKLPWSTKVRVTKIGRASCRERV